MDNNLKNLYDLQDEILNVLSEYAKENNFPFNFTAGTALVRFYSKRPYRISYDLDFFSTSGINNFDFDELNAFLKKKFQKVENLNKLSEKTSLYRLIIFNSNTAVKVDFVEDLFSGAFTGKKLNDDLNINIEPIYAIYTRKIWALVSSLEDRNSSWDRLKDVIDLIELENIYTQFEDFFTGEFKEIAKQNGIDIPFGKMLSYFQSIEEIILRDYAIFKNLLERDYKCIFKLEEVLKWIEKKQKALRHV